MIDQDSFDTALTLIEILREKRQVFVALTPPFTVTFDVNRQTLERALREASLERAAFDEAAGEIGEMVLAILEEKKQHYISRQTVAIEDEGKKKEAVEALERRLEQVAPFVDGTIRSRFDLKVASKAPAFSAIDWDVKLKTFDARLGQVRLPYATISLKWQREFRFEIATLLQRNLFDSVQINFTRDEVDYVIRELELVRDRLDVDEKEADQ